MKLRPALRPPLRAPRRGPNAPREGVGWWDPASLIDADFATGRFRFNAQNYPDETTWLAAIGGSKSGITRTIGPYVTGTEVLADGGFSSGVDSWADAPDYAANGDVSQVSNRLRMSWTGAGTSYSARRATTVTDSRAYLFQATITGRSSSAVSAIALTAAVNQNLYGGASVAANLGSALPQTLSIIQASYPGLPLHFGVVGGGTASAANWLEIDDASVKEVVPYNGFQAGRLSARLSFTTPAAASGNKVLAEWSDQNTSRASRVRVVFDASAHLRVIVTQDSFEWTNLDLGAVDVSTAHTLAMAVTDNRVSASLDGASLATDTSATIPGLGQFRIGRSLSGETWDGTIERVKVYAEALSDAVLTSPFESFYIFGDSTAAGSGATGANLWYNVLAAAYSPDRTAVSAGVGGETTAQMLARVQADTDHRGWTTIFMDRPNSNAEGDWIANMKAAAALLGTSQWLVVPPVLNSPSGQPDTTGTIIGTIQATLLSDPFFAGHTFGASEQAAYIAEMNDDATRQGGGDWTHFNDAGQALQAARIKTTLDALGW